MLCQYDGVVVVIISRKQWEYWIKKVVVVVLGQGNGYGLWSGVFKDGKGGGDEWLVVGQLWKRWRQGRGREGVRVTDSEGGGEEGDV